MKRPVALVGTGSRAAGTYAEALRRSDQFELVALIGRTEGKTASLAERLGVPWGLDLEDAKRHGARGLILCVSAHRNGPVATDALALGLPMLVETPLALEFDEARALVDPPVPIEVAEQNPRFPEVLLWRQIVEAGWLGRVQAVASDAAGYRYHATAVARALLGRAEGRYALGTRTVFDDDFGRGLGPEALYAGSVTTVDGRLFQLRDGEPLHLGAWQRGGWWVAGDRGSLRPSGVALRDGTHHPIERQDGAWRCGDLSVRCTEDEDVDAVGRCLSDWAARIDGRITPTGWSAEDGLRDLAWAVGIERAAILGARVSLPDLLQRGGA